MDLFLFVKFIHFNWNSSFADSLFRENYDHNGLRLLLLYNWFQGKVVNSLHCIVGLLHIVLLLLCQVSTGTNSRNKANPVHVMVNVLIKDYKFNHGYISSHLCFLPTHSVDVFHAEEGAFRLDNCLFQHRVALFLTNGRGGHKEVVELRTVGSQRVILFEIGHWLGMGIGYIAKMG